jgi:hypothetical protein
MKTVHQLRHLYLRTGLTTKHRPGPHGRELTTVGGVLDTSVDSLVHGGSDQDGGLLSVHHDTTGIMGTHDLNEVDTNKMTQALFISLHQHER